MTRIRIRFTGQVQGVGFRPFLWTLATELQLTGTVRNDSLGVTVEIQGPPAAIDRFWGDFEKNLPPLAVVDTMASEEIPTRHETEFTILDSSGIAGESTRIAPDIAVCADCAHELADPRDRRYRYPFTNCTNCGPRFTIIEDIPYDRPMTTMKSFRMCAECQREYDQPSDRRFHAQPNACPRCGPTIWLTARDQIDAALDGPTPEVPAGDDALVAFAAAIGAGQIVAVKGIGGFHLACDAANPVAVALLRQRKGRIDKPFALMVKDVRHVAEFAVVGDEELRLLESKERPIVLLQKRPLSRVAEMLECVAPGNEFIGVMLPYSPLHLLLVEAAAPLVMTSGNISDEPIVRTNQEANNRLENLADSFLLHNREIHAVCDDSVVRSVDGRLLPIRRSRGYAPMPVRLRDAGPSVLAVGGEIKATFCVTKTNYAYMSQHIGDVGNLETLEALQRNVEQFLKLFRIDVAAVAGDLHPGYLSSQWARQLAATLGVDFIPVQHHFAHAVSLMTERQIEQGGEIIVCCFDGTGYGSDAAIWGGEFLAAGRQTYDRIGHLEYFPLPGGDAGIKKPYRAALALLSQYGLEWEESLPSVSACMAVERRVLRKQIQDNLHCTATSSMGRLFDAVASLMGIRHEVSYEAQAAMEMEAAASQVIQDVAGDAYSFEFGEGDTITIGCRSLLRSICRDITHGIDRRVIAAEFHQAVARMIRAASEIIRRRTGLNTVGLTGGVFQNVLLLKLAEKELRSGGFEVLTHSTVPPNDGGLALGQAVVARGILCDGRGAD